MSVERNKQVVRRFYDEVWNHGRLAAADDLFAPQFRDTDAPPDVPPGPSGVKEFVALNLRRFSDLHYTLDDLIAEGDLVAAVWTAAGINTGDLGHRNGPPLAPTGKRVAWRGVTIFRLADGQIAEYHITQNLLGVFRDLGLVADAV
ncbi:MAG: ester cyclase [Anaerolineae bacterium]